MKYFIAAGMAVLLIAGAVYAGIPSATTSTVEREGMGTPDCNPDVAVVCPAGDMGYVRVTVTVRNVYGDPLADKEVTAYPVGSGFCFCTGEDSKVDTTDANGQVVFDFMLFGGCGDLQFGADCEGVTFNPSSSIYIASPDGNGDCSVDLSDFITFAGIYLSTDTCFDFNCDGSVDLSDFIAFASHYIHACP